MSSSAHDHTGIDFANERGAPPPEAQPKIEVHSWRMFKASSAELHLGTLCDREAERAVVRLTSAIAAIDVVARVVITSSGRRYVLVTPPETRAVERMAICNGAAHLGLVHGIDVSNQIWADMTAV